MKPEETNILLEKEIKKGEKLLWYGRPGQGILFFPVDIFMIPFSVLWGGGSIIWEIIAIFIFINEPELNHFFFVMFGIPFVILGLHMIIGRFILDKKQRESIYYGITNERILIIQGKKHRKTTSLFISKLNNIAFSESENGKGTIIFGKRDPFDFFFVRGLMPKTKLTPVSFEMIDNVKDVYKTINEVKKGRV